jgi:uncharacterized protein (TIGR03435 family)
MKALSIVLFGAFSVVFAHAQASPPAFEVSSVKRNLSGSASAISGMVRGDRFTSTNITPTQLLRSAFGIQEFQIAGKPRWSNDDRFDIEAKAEHDLKSTDWPPMLQTLLAERFKLVFHREQRETSAYALVIAKNGPKLTRVEAFTCDRPDPDACSNMAGSPISIVGENVTMNQLASRLSRSIGRQVTDKTRLDGRFSLKVEWPQEERIAEPGASASAGIFTALQEQIGLKLESTKEPVDVIVIDKVERPAEN